MTDKKIALDLEEIQLPTNTPKVYTEYEPYATILKKKVEDPNVKNIGIVAPYGAGKSSLIATYIENEKKSNPEFEKNIISISLANYSSIVKEIEPKENTINTENSVSCHSDSQKRCDNHISSIDAKNEQEIEKSILQQLFYKNNNENTPASRFKVLQNNTKNNILLTVLITLCTVSTLFITFQFFDNLFKINPAWDYKWYFIVSAIIISVITFSLISFGIIRSKYVKSIQVGDLHFEKNESESISIFNQYLDEIIYFFQNNDFKILIIEDLDRFNNLDIFSKLKELNTLLNNNDGIKKKHKKITFVYAVKDSMFNNEEERSKFFEFILPVIPSITSDNVRDELSKELKTILNLKDIPLSSQLVIDISDYISSRRILNNIISDFLIHMSLLQIDSNNNKNLDKLFALMLLKNVLPLEYERLQGQSKKSIIYNILNSTKTQVQSVLCREIKIEIDKLTNYFLDLKKEKLKNLDELHYLLSGVLLKENPGFVSLTTSIESFYGIKTLNYKYRTNSYYNQTSTAKQDITPLEEKYFDEAGYFYNREKNIINNSKEKHEELVNKKNSLTEQIHKILNMTFFELYDLYPDEFPNEIFEENLIKLLLVNGYIDETHMDFLSKHKDDFITYNDKQVKQRINRKEKLNIFEKIDSPERLIISLEKNRFNSINILNYYVVKELVENSSSHKEKYETFIECINRNISTFKLFIEQVANFDYEYSEFFIKLTKEKPEVFKWIYESTVILQEKKSSILWSIINGSNITESDIISINESGCLTEFINHSSEFCNKYTNNNCDIEILDNILRIELISIDNFVENKYSKYILEHDRYCFTIKNINTILSDFYGVRKALINVKNYEVISSLPECSLKARVINNLNEYIRKLYNAIETGDLSSDSFIELLVNKSIDLETKKLIVSKEVAVIPYVADLEDEILEQLVSQDQIILTTSHILEIFKKISPTVVSEYLINHIGEIEINQNVLKENEEFKSFFFNYVDIFKYLNKIGDCYSDISKFSNTNNILLLIKNHKCLYSLDDFCEFCNNTEILTEYCKIFDKEILNDIKLKAIDFDQDNIAVLYKIAKKLKASFLNEIIKLIEKEALNKILTYESPDEFYSSLTSPTILTKSCKLGLLENRLNISLKEDLLCHINTNELKDSEWTELMKKTIALNTNKYSPKTNVFYHTLKERNVKCKKHGKTIVFENCS